VAAGRDAGNTSFYLRAARGIRRLNEQGYVMGNINACDRDEPEHQGIVSAIKAIKTDAHELAVGLSVLADGKIPSEGWHVFLPRLKQLALKLERTANEVSEYGAGIEGG
jgi:hypothetical protein